MKRNKARRSIIPCYECHFSTSAVPTNGEQASRSYRFFVRDKKRAGYVQRNVLSRHRYESRKRYYERNIDCLPYGRFTIANKTRPTRVGGNWSAAAIEMPRTDRSFMVHVPTIQTVYLDVMLNRTLDSSIFHRGNWVIRFFKGIFG